MVGHIMFSDLTIATDRGTIDALSLAPLAVPTDKGKVSARCWSGRTARR